jgi:spore protease
MEKSFRTDLAAEARAAWLREGGGDLPGAAEGSEERDGFAVHVVEIREKEAAETLCKPMGRYVSLDLAPLLRREENAFYRACAVLAEELRRMLALSPGDGVLAVCLGNPDMTPDAVGPLCAGHLLVTSHLKRAMPEDFAVFRSVSVLCTGVLGTTGVESSRLARAVTELVRPAAVVAVDALAAADAERLCRTVQITDAGIVPGSGVGNARAALNRETLGVPVVAVGVPTVVDAAVLRGSGAPGEMFVTPRDIDARVRESARLAGYAVNLALHDGLALADLESLLS